MSQVKPDGLVTADYSENTKWGDDDPSIFLMTNVRQLQGEFQVTNGYGPDKAPSVMMVRLFQMFRFCLSLLVKL